MNGAVEEMVYLFSSFEKFLEKGRVIMYWTSD